MPKHSCLQLRSLLLVFGLGVIVVVVVFVVFFFVFERSLQIAHFHHNYVIAARRVCLRAAHQKARVRILGSVLTEIVENDVKAETWRIFI